MKILGISGSLRAASYNTALLRAAADLAPAGVEVELYEELESLPPYNEDRDTDLPPAEVRERVRGSPRPTPFCSPRRSSTARCRAR